jgi:hypothetical protein
MLHIIYRSYDGENNKDRPAFYSKVVALASCIRAFEGLKAGTAEIIYLNDGPIRAERIRLMERSGEVLACSGLGMKGSMRRALAIPYQRAWPADDLVWFAEDDYLYQPQAFKDLVAAATALPDADYFALYALIDGLLPNGSPSVEYRVRWFPGRWLERRCVAVEDRCWQRALSTTSTFGGRSRAIVEDGLLMKIAMIYGGAWDHTTCMLYQGLCPFPYDSLVEPLRSNLSCSIGFKWLPECSSMDRLNTSSPGCAWSSLGYPSRNAILGARSGLDLRCGGYPTMVDGVVKLAQERLAFWDSRFWRFVIPYDGEIRCWGEP